MFLLFHKTNSIVKRGWVKKFSPSPPLRFDIDLLCKTLEESGTYPNLIAEQPWNHFDQCIPNRDPLARPPLGQYRWFCAFGIISSYFSHWLTASKCQYFSTRRRAQMSQYCLPTNPLYECSSEEVSPPTHNTFKQEGHLFNNPELSPPGMSMGHFFILVEPS